MSWTVWPIFAFLSSWKTWWVSCNTDLCWQVMQLTWLVKAPECHHKVLEWQWQLPLAIGNLTQCFRNCDIVHNWFLGLLVDAWRVVFIDKVIVVEWHVRLFDLDVPVRQDTLLGSSMSISKWRSWRFNGLRVSESISVCSTSTKAAQ